jgi:hypothetical protein
MERKLDLSAPSWAVRLDQAVAEAFGTFCFVVMLVVVLGLAGLGFWYVMNLKVWELIVGSISIGALLYVSWQYLKLAWIIGEAYDFLGLIIFVFFLTPMAAYALILALNALRVFGSIAVSIISAFL